MLYIAYHLHIIRCSIYYYNAIDHHIIDSGPGGSYSIQPMQGERRWGSESRMIATSTAWKTI